jgi:membrane protein DedA with SNARE-associated domain
VSAFPGVGIPVVFAVLAVTESGVPLPVPADVLMLLVGERTAAHQLPLWLAVIGLELVVLVGTTLLFFAARGPLRGLIGRVGPHVGLTRQRLERATSLLEHRGQAAIAVGRATPSLRTMTVIASATSRLTPRRALAWLVLGGSFFLQLHLVSGTSSARRHSTCSNAPRCRSSSSPAHSGSRSQATGWCDGVPAAARSPGPRRRARRA